MPRVHPFVPLTTSSDLDAQIISSLDTTLGEFVVDTFRTGLRSTVALRKWEQLYIAAIQDTATGITELKNLQVFSVELPMDILDDHHAMTEHYRLVDNFKGYTKIHFLKLQEKMKDKKVKREDITPINILVKRYFLKFIIWFILTWPFGLGAAVQAAWSSGTTTVAHFDCSGKSRHYISCQVIGQHVPIAEDKCKVLYSYITAATEITDIYWPTLAGGWLAAVVTLSSGLIDDTVVRHVPDRAREN